jgi:hypothetical protein
MIGRRVLRADPDAHDLQKCGELIRRIMWGDSRVPWPRQTGFAAFKFEIVGAAR